jgi:hypothetical protein
MALARTRTAALRMLVEDRDDAVAALAAQHALAIDRDGELREAVAHASERRPSLRAMLEYLFGPPPAAFAREAADG